MSTFDDFYQPKELEGDLVGGSFYCSAPGCRKQCDEAYYLEGKLSWLCASGHTSTIEFKL